MFGSKLKERQYLDLRTAELWAIALKNANLTMSEFRFAATKSLELQWPPTAAGDFIALARPQQKTYPDVNTAFETACKCAGMRGMSHRDWKHAVVRETANRIGWGKLASASEGYLPSFRRIYEQVVAEHQAGATFVIKEAKRINPPKPTKLDDDSPVAKRWDSMIEAMGIKARRQTTEVKS